MIGYFFYELKFRTPKNAKISTTIKTIADNLPRLTQFINLREIDTDIIW
jgi:hypothetical protein